MLPAGQADTRVSQLQSYAQFMQTPAPEGAPEDSMTAQRNSHSTDKQRPGGCCQLQIDSLRQATAL